DAPVSRYLAAVRNIERFESGGAFRVTKRISSPPRIEDFAPLVVPPEDVKDLRTCKVSECEVKLPASAIERMQREVDWRRPDAGEQVNRIARDQALQVSTAYLR